MTDNGIWADKFIKREMLPAGELAQRFNIHNPRLHPESQRAATESSLDTVGWIDEVSLSTNGDGPPSLADNSAAVMFDGHERVEIALVRGGPDTPVPVNWYQLTPEETDFALLAKDQTSAMAQIDPVKMADLMERTKAMTTAPGLQGMLERLKEQVADGLLAQNGNGAGSDTPPAIDKAAELQEKWQVQPGQLWELGEHRIVCGDCTDAAVVELVMGGERADMVFTDPPYGVAVGDKNKYLTSIARNNRSEENLENDTLDETRLTIMLCSSFDNAISYCTTGASWYVAAPPGPLHILFGQVLKDRGIWRQTIQWVKNNATFSPMGVCYHWQAEPLFFGWLPNGGHRWYGGRKETTVWNIDRPLRSPEHPTMKPIELVERAIVNSSRPDDFIYDPFLGSGSTLIACQNLGRRCRGVEIEPKYVAVTLQRFLDHTGIQPRLLETVEA